MHRLTGTVLVVAVLAATAPAGAAAPPAAAGKAPEKHLIRWKFNEIQELKYKIAVQGQGRWTPDRHGHTRGQLQTDFTFTLEPKLVRESGACTFRLIGERLKSKGKGNKGSVHALITQQSCSVRIGDLVISGDKANPLKKEITTTHGPLGGFRYGTGLLPLAPYFAVHVHRGFWGPLTRAPLGPVGKGDAWDADFDFHIPDSVGQPLQVKAHAIVTGWESYKGRRCLAGRLTARLKLKDTWVTMRDAERAHVSSGDYKASGKVLWDVEKGILCYAEAQNTLSVRVDKPKAASFSGRAQCTFALRSSK